jgi:hypothetical protein
LSSGIGVKGTSVGGYGLWATSQTGTAGHFEGSLEVNGDINHTGAFNLTGNLTVSGDIWMHADFAEDFSVQAKEPVEPGTVMVLGQDGLLRSCEKGYDRKVVGVISGAGDYRPALVLDRQKSAQGRSPVSLVGKVYCKVDAEYGPVEVGDLLATSPTPGYAMKVSNPTLAFGAVLGKALGSLDSGRGLIPILVSLQ